MGSWVSKLVGVAQVPPLQQELVTHGPSPRPEGELEHHINMDTPILRHDANAVGEVSDVGGPALESGENGTNNHVDEIPSSPSARDTHQRNEEPRNDSRHSPSLLGNQAQEREFKTRRTFAYWSGSISFTGAVGMVGARIGNLSVNIRKLPFYICSTSLSSAFIISMLLLTLTSICPAPRSLTAIMKFTQCLISGLFILAIGFSLAMVL